MREILEWSLPTCLVALLVPPHYNTIDSFILYAIVLNLGMLYTLPE